MSFPTTGRKALLYLRPLFRHYTKGPRSYIPTDFGHCPYPRMKIRTLRDSCPRWKPDKRTPARP